MNHLWLLLRRWLLRNRQLERPFRELIRESSPDPGTSFRDAELVCLDIETTGLDVATADMLSVGWVLVRNGRVALDTAESYVVKPSGAVGNSAAVHGLTDTIVESGRNWKIVLDKIIETLVGRVLVVHHAGLDKALLDRMCRQRFGAPLMIPVADTMALEHRRQRRRHHADENSSLRLTDLRAAYNLPRYDSHDCLVDAIATAELLIAMVAQNDGLKSTRLKDLYA